MTASPWEGGQVPPSVDALSLNPQYLLPLSALSQHVLPWNSCWDTHGLQIRTGWCKTDKEMKHRCQVYIIFFFKVLPAALNMLSKEVSWVIDKLTWITNCFYKHFFSACQSCNLLLFFILCVSEVNISGFWTKRQPQASGNCEAHNHL